MYARLFKSLFYLCYSGVRNEIPSTVLHIARRVVRTRKKNLADPARSQNALPLLHPCRLRFQTVYLFQITRCRQPRRAVF